MSGAAYFYSTDFLAHDPPPDQLRIKDATIDLGAANTSSASLTALTHEVIVESGVLEQMRAVDPEPIEESLLQAVHDPDYLRRLDAACAGGPWDSHSASLVAETATAARLAAGAATGAVRLALGGTVERAFVNARPTGHHAERRQTMGNCFLNNVACAAQQAVALGCERVMIVDWDVHAGNGAQDIFWDCDSVLALSIHQERWYPRHAGHLTQTGGREAVGTTVNVPLPPATTDAGYMLVLESIVRPVAERFAPELLIVAAGQDPAIFDPMGRMLVSADGFRRMGGAVRGIADDVCGGRLVCSVEGGYSHLYSPLCTLAALEGLMDVDAHVPDPYADDPELDAAADPPSDAVRAVVDAVRATQARWFA